jgi:hypothetical protein
MKDKSEASARPAKVAEATSQPMDSTSENKNLSAKKGGSPALSLEQQIVQLNSTVARLSRELETVKAQIQEKAKDIAVDLKLLWENSDLHFDNEKKLQNALKTSLQPHSRGPKTEDRITQLKNRLKSSSNLWIAKADLARAFGMKRTAFHWFYLILKASGEFETTKRAGRVYIRLARAAPAVT